MYFRLVCNMGDITVLEFTGAFTVIICFKSLLLYLPNTSPISYRSSTFSSLKTAMAASGVLSPKHWLK